MSKSIEQFRQTDVTTWGVAALVSVGFALVAGSIGALLPDSLLARLHTTRLEATNVVDLTAKVELLERRTRELRDQADTLRAQVALSGQSRNQNSSRVAALEAALPTLLEAIPPGTNIDRSLLTASVAGETGTKPTEGGYVSVATTPLFETGDGATATAGVANQPLPELARPERPADLMVRDGYGVALGPRIDAGAANITWMTLSRSVGTLLVGLEPLLAWDEVSGARRIVAGPIDRISQAEQLCTLVIRRGVTCLPIGFSGSPVTP